jgi:hypothetical protein
MLSIVFGASFTIATAWALGTLLLRKFTLPLRRVEEWLLAILVGSACLSAIVFGLCTAKLGRKSVYLVLGLLIITVAIGFREKRPLQATNLPPLPRLWKTLFAVVFTIVTVVYLFEGLTPKAPLDAVTERLSRLDRAHGFDAFPTLSDGTAMLFLYPFAIGRQPAAALVKLALLVSVTLLMLWYGRHIGHHVVGVAGALLAYASPAFGIGPTAAALFVLVYLVQPWARGGQLNSIDRRQRGVYQLNNKGNPGLEMRPRLDAAIKLLLALALVAIFAACVFRAVTQPITTDEARVYLDYIHGQDFGAIFTRKYDAANHVLQTILSYWAVKLLGGREVVLRSPSLVAAVLYFIAIWRFAFLSFRRTWLAALAVGLAVLNPLLLDHFSLARGYGLGLALFTWSLYFSLRFLCDRNERVLTLAGLFLALSLTANLTFAIPGAGLAFALLASLPIGLRHRAIAVRYAASALLPAALLLVVPLSSAHRTDFYFGSPTYAGSIVELTNPSLVYGAQAPLFPDLTVPYVRTIRQIDYWIVPVALLGIGLVAGAGFRDVKPSPAILGLRLSAGSVILAVLTLIVGHRLSNLAYPYGRTGLYLLFLFPLAFLAAVNVLFDWGRAFRLAAIPGIAAMVLILSIYGLEFHTGNFEEWPFAADIKNVANLIQGRTGGRPARVDGSFVFAGPLNYYRDLYGWTWLDPAEQVGPRPGYDFYLLVPEDRHFVDDFHLQVLQDTGQTILATSHGR